MLYNSMSKFQSPSIIELNTDRSSITQWTLSALMSQHKNGGVSVGTFVNFVWVTIGEKILSDHISAKKAGKELKPTGMVVIRKSKE